MFSNCIYIEFQKIIKHKKDHPNLHNLSVGYLGRGITYFKSGKFLLAKRDFDDAINLDQSYPDPYIYRSSLYIRSKNYKYALSDTNHAIKYSSNPKLLIQRAIIYEKMQKYKLAIHDLKESIKKDTKNTKVYSLLGLFYCHISEYENAIKNYNKYLDIYPNDPIALNNYSFCLITANPPNFRDYKKALKISEYAVKLTNKKDPLLLGTLAAAYASNGIFDKAVETQKLAITFENNDNKNILIKMKTALRFYKNHKLYYGVPGASSVVSPVEQANPVENNTNNSAIEFRVAYKTYRPDRIPAQLPKKEEIVFLGPVQLATEHLVAIETKDNKEYYNDASALITFTEKDGRIISKITKENSGEKLAMLIDGKIIFCGLIIHPINSNQIQLSGGYTFQEIKALAKKMSKYIERN